MVARAARSAVPKTAPTEAPTTAVLSFGHRVVVEVQAPVVVGEVVGEVDCVAEETFCKTTPRLTVTAAPVLQQPAVPSALQHQCPLEQGIRTKYVVPASY
jgi:hypothetical protein